MAEAGLRVEREGFVAVVTIDRPQVANCLDTPTLHALRDAVASLAGDTDARAVLFTSAGEKAFCAGADLKERIGMDPGAVRDYIRTIRDTLTAIARMPQPTIAAVNGAALGGGTELALACDIRIAAAGATLGLTETGLGIIPGGGGTQRLSRLIGLGRAKEMIFTARRVGSEEALQIGLVHEVVPLEMLTARAAELAQRIASNAPVAVRAAKEAVDRGIELSLDEGLALESALYERTLDTKDRLEGLAAFREKRKPEYRGE